MNVAMTNAAAPSPSPNLVLGQRWCLLVGVVSLAALIAGGIFDPPQFFRAYLSAHLFFFGIGMGSMLLVMIYHITGGAWGFLIRRILEAGMATLPLLALGFVPIALGVGYLYPWAQPNAAASSELIRFQQPYMNPPSFAARAAGYFTVWLAIAYLLSAGSRAQDRTGNRWLAWRLDGLSGLGLVVYGITIHFAALDWLMSLDPAFHSTIFAPLMASGHLLSGLALALIVLAAFRRRDLGNLLLSFVIVWTYMCWFQYMLIWIANLPVDVVWYAPRLVGGWKWVALMLLILHFVVPLLLLLQRAVKQNLRALAGVAALLLVMQWVFMVFQVEPAFPTANRLVDHWMDFVAPLALGGIWFGFFLRQLRQHPLLPTHDLNELSAVRLRHTDEEEAALEEALSHG